MYSELGGGPHPVLAHVPSELGAGRRASEVAKCAAEPRLGIGGEHALNPAWDRAPTLWRWSDPCFPVKGKDNLQSEVAVFS